MHGRKIWYFSNNFVEWISQKGSLNMKITIDGYVDKSEAVFAPVPGDYVGEDGMLYCGKCRTPK